MLFLLYPFHFCTVNVKAKDQSCKVFWLNNSGLFVGLVQQPLCTILFLLHHPAHHKCACTQSTSYCCWASALTSVRRSCVLRFNQSFCSLESCHGRFSSRLTASISAFFSGSRAEQVCRCGRHDLCQRISHLTYTRCRFCSNVRAFSYWPQSLSAPDLFCLSLHFQSAIGCWPMRERISASWKSSSGRYSCWPNEVQKESSRSSGISSFSR